MLLIPGILASKFTPQGDFESIATVTVGSGGAADIQFTSIPGTFQHLQIRVIARSASTSGGSTDALNMQFNGDTTTNYAVHQLIGNGSTASSIGAGNFGSLQASVLTTAGATSNAFGAIVVDVLDYDDTNKFKTVRSLSGGDSNGSGQVMFGSSLWRSTSAITSIKIYPASSTFVQHSHFALYGIKG